MKLKDVVEKYLQLRDAKEAAKKIFEEEQRTKYTEPMEKIEAAFLKLFNESGQTSAAVKGVGTAFVKERSSDKVTDREAFLKFAQKKGNIVFLDVRVAKAALDEYIEKTGDLPPGVTRSIQRVVNIRRGDK